MLTSFSKRDSLNPSADPCLLVVHFGCTHLAILLEIAVQPSNIGEGMRGMIAASLQRMLAASLQKERCRRGSYMFAMKGVHVNANALQSQSIVHELGTCHR